MPRTRDGLKGYQGLFLALTLIVMVIIILTAKDLTTAVLLISLITSFLIISTQLTLIGDRSSKTVGRTGHRGAEFAGAAAVTAPALLVQPAYTEGFAGDQYPGAIAGKALRSALEGEYPGAIAGGALEGEYPGAIADGAESGEAAAMFGHYDRAASSSAEAPIGSPFDTDRIGQPSLGLADDEANAALDGDELVAVQARSRNDPLRVWAGIPRRKELLDYYVREELDEEENRRWWGVHEI